MCTNEKFDILVMLKNHDPDELEDILSKIRDIETSAKKESQYFYIKCYS